MFSDLRVGESKLISRLFYFYFLGLGIYVKKGTGRVNREGLWIEEIATERTFLLVSTRVLFAQPVQG